MITKASTNRPQPVSRKEWREIVHLNEFREAWGIYDEPPDNIESMLYGARFDFVSGGPGYVGPLYLIYGDALSGPPLVVIRQQGRLQALPA